MYLQVYEDFLSLILDMSDMEAEQSHLPVVEDKSKIKFKSNVGAGVFRILFREAEFREAKRNIFKGNCVYDFDVDANFGDSLPKLVIRNRDKSSNEERSVIPVINPSIHSKMLKVVPYIIEGKKIEKKEPESNFGQSFLSLRKNTN
jgi:RED-like protein N-terminal region.